MSAPTLTGVLEELIMSLPDVPGATETREGRVVEVATSGWTELYTLVPAAAGALPGSLVWPQLRSAVHLALDADVFLPQAVAPVVLPFLRDERRFGQTSGVALGGRKRLARLCAVAAAAERATARAFDADVRRNLETAALRLAMDRDAGAGQNAAWALGILSPSTAGFAEWIADALSAGASPQRRRRGIVARVARFAHYERDPQALSELIGSAAVRSDPYTRGQMLRALRLAVEVDEPSAFEVACTLVGPGFPTPTAEILESLYELAAALAPERRAQVLAPHAARARELSETSGTLRAWVDPSPAAANVLSGFDDLVRAARRSPVLAHAAAIALMDTMGGADLAGADTLAVFDRVVLGDTMLRDALFCRPALPAVRTKRYGLWLDLVARLRQRGLGTLLAKTKPSVADGQGAARLLVRALDESPRGASWTGLERHARQLDDDATRAHGLALATLLTDEGQKDALARPLAFVWTVAGEILGARDSMRGPELVDELLCMVNTRVAAHLESGGLRADHLELVRDLLQISRPPVDEGALGVLGRVRDRMGAIAASAGLGAQLVDSLLDALSYHGRRPIAANQMAASRAFEIARRLQVGVGARAGLAEFGSSPGQRRIEAALRRLYGGTPEEQQTRMPWKKARDNVRDALPRSLAPLADGLVPPLDQAPTSRGGRYDPGRKIGESVIEKRLGSGAMGLCLLVRRGSDPQRKVVKLPLDRRADGLRMFIEEAQALLELAKHPHPNVIEFLALDRYSHRLPFLVMRFAEGESLEKRLFDGGQPRPFGSPAACFWFTAQMARALAHCHAMGITHHDLKPGNIVVMPDGRPMLVDFGIAAAGRIAGTGTPGYMAPERFDPERELKDTTPADVYALGCVLYEVLTGHDLFELPFDAYDLPKHPMLVELSERLHQNQPIMPLAMAALYQAVTGDAGLIKRRAELRLAGEVSADAMALLLEMLHVRPARRPRMGDVAARLERIQAHG